MIGFRSVRSQPSEAVELVGLTHLHERCLTAEKIPRVQMSEKPDRTFRTEVFRTLSCANASIYRHPLPALTVPHHIPLLSKSLAFEYPSLCLQTTNTNFLAQLVPGVFSENVPELSPPVKSRPRCTSCPQSCIVMNLIRSMIASQSNYSGLW